MSGRKRRRKSTGDVGSFLDNFVVVFFSIPLFPLILWASGQDTATFIDDLPGLLLLACAFWGIAGVVAWRAGGPDYVVDQLCFALLFVPFLPWLLVLLSVEPAPRGGHLIGLLGTTASLWAAAAVLRWRFELWPFESKEVRGQRHSVAVFHVDPPEKDFEPYFLAICDCGWMGDFHDAAEPSFADGRTHSPDVEPEIQRPLDPDHVPRPRDAS